MSQTVNEFGVKGSIKVSEEGLLILDRLADNYEEHNAFNHVFWARY